MATLSDPAILAAYDRVARALVTADGRKPLLTVCPCPIEVWHQESHEGGSWWQKPCRLECNMEHNDQCICHGTGLVLVDPHVETITEALVAAWMAVVICGEADGTYQANVGRGDDGKFAAADSPLTALIEATAKALRVWDA